LISILAEKLSNDFLWDSICIITFYSEQVKYLEDEIYKDKKLYQLKIAVSTVDSFQGSEKDIVFLSCVRSHGVGFVKDAQRLVIVLFKDLLVECCHFSCKVCAVDCWEFGKFITR